MCFQEDMNLNEERKAPLREKDLSTKREMVVQYISATAKSVSEPDPTVPRLWRGCRGRHPAADWIHPSPLLRGFMLCRLSLHTPTFDSLPLALFAMLDSHSSDCDFDFVAFTFSAQTSSGRSESSSLSHSNARWMVSACLALHMHGDGLFSTCVLAWEHFQVMAGNATLSLKKQSWRNWVRIKQMWQNSADNGHLRLRPKFRFLQ